MSRIIVAITVGTTMATCLSACGGSSGSTDGSAPGGGGPVPPTVSYVGTTGVFAAWVNDTSGNYSAAKTDSYAGKKQSLRGTVDFMTGENLSQPAGIEIYKYSDGHIYGLDLTSSGTPAAQQLSSESAATLDV